MFFIKRLFFLLGCAIVLCGLALQAAPVYLKSKEVHPTRLIAKLKSQGITTQSHTAALSANGLKVLRQSSLVSGLVVLSSENAKTVNALVQADPATQLQSQIDALKKTGLYDYVEPDYIVHAVVTPTDAKFVDGTLWGLRNTGQSSGTSGVDVGAVQAWNVTTGSTNVIIAVIDSGIRYTHHDLAAQMWHNPGETAGNSTDDDHDGYVDDVYGINAITGSGNPMDDNDHGTHVSGTIGASANDAYPIVGVCWNVRLMACKFLDSNGSGATSDAIECVNYAVAHGAKILNNSWGGSGYSQGMHDAIAAAGAQGVLFVAAAGNDGDNNDSGNFYPANYALDNVISVAAIDRNDHLASFSNYGRQSVHVGAPGVDIYSSTSGSDSEYQVFSGTSMATPHVSGVAGLILAQFPNISVQDLRSRIFKTVVVTPALLNTTTTGGRVNAYQALTAAPSGTLQLVLTSDTGETLLAGRTTRFFLRVNDLDGITNATITANSPSVGVVSFINTGVSPDQTAHDSTYSASLTVPTNISSMAITVIAQASGKIGVTNTFNLTVIPPPVNDLFTNSTPLTGTGVSVTGSNFGADTESGEPDPTGHAGGKSVWWSWTAPTDGQATITTLGSSFDTVLGVYLGDTLGSLTQVATNDDASSSTTTSTVSFQAGTGNVYHILVDGYDGATGDITLNVSLNGNIAPPVNDNFTNRIMIPGVSATVKGSNLGASRESGEPAHAGNTGGKSVWWSWTAPANGVVSVSTASSTFDTTLGVYLGESVNALSVVTSNDDNQPLHTSLVSFVVVAGNNYKIAVDGYNGDSGNIVLSLSYSSLPVPANDSFANSVAISGLTNKVIGYNTGATKQSGEPNHAGNSGGASVWWKWTAPASQLITMTTADSSFHTVLGIYTGTSVAALTEVVSDVGSGTNGTSQVTFAATEGVTYQIAVDGVNDGSGAANGVVYLSVAPRVANDLLRYAIAITGNSNTVFGANIGATIEPGEPQPAGQPGGASVWWKWTPTFTGLATVSTVGSSFDTLLGIYTGTDVASLTTIAGDNDSGGDLTSRVYFHATAGTTYRIAVDGLNGDGGQIVLNVNVTPAPANDAFAHRLALTGGLKVTAGSSLGASKESGEPNHASQPGGASVWWSWTAPSNGLVNITTAGSSFDTLLGVYTGGAVSTLAPVAANDDANTNHTSAVAFTAVAGTIYKIAVDDKNGLGGDVVLNIAYAPPNDLFAHRISYSGGSNALSGYNIGAIKEANEPDHATNSGGASVWWTWTAPSNGVASITTDGSSFDTLLAVYTGIDLATLVPVVSNDDDATDTNSTVNFEVTAGTVYQIAVDGKDGATGNIVLHSRLYISPAVITSQPVSVRAVTNTAVKFAVTATGTRVLAYQWFLNGTAVAHATNSLLSLPHVQLADGGSYTLVVSNPAGSATSSTATLTVVNETILPIITITSGPAANARTTNLVVAFVGKASDKSGIAQVVAQANGGSFLTANGTTNWSTSMTNIPGTNIFVVKAIDANTNESLPVTRKFFYVVTNGLTLITNAPIMGGITKTFTSTNLEIGRGYTVTAVAKTGFLFSNWSGTISSNKAALNFLMQSNMVLSANFVTNPFPAIKGIYTALFYDTNGIAQPSSGLATFTLTDSGSYSGTIQISGGSYQLNGVFDLNGHSQTTVLRPNIDVLTVILQLNLGAPDDKVTGTVADGTWLAQLTGDRAVFNATTNKATNFIGSYTMAIPGGTNAAADVGGDGYATLTIDASGTIRVIGKLGDATSISQSVHISKDGRWPFYVSLYAGKGSILGWLTFSNQPANIFGGSINWIKPVSVYSPAFSETKTVIGSVFHTPAVSTTGLINIGNSTVVLSGGNLSTSISNGATINPTSIIVSGTNHIVLTLNRSTGMMTGSFTHPDLHKSATITGVILQEQNLGYGYFLGTTQSGSLRVMGN